MLLCLPQQVQFGFLLGVLNLGKMAWHQGQNNNPIPNFSLSLQNPQQDRDRAPRQKHQVTWGQIKTLSAQSTKLLQEKDIPQTPENFLVAAFACLNANSVTIVMCIFFICIFPFSTATLTLQDGNPEQGLWERNSYIGDVQNISRVVNKTDCWICMHVPTHTQGGILIHAVPFNETRWKTFTWKDGGVRGFKETGTNVILAIGSRFQEIAAYCWEFTNTTKHASINVGKYPYCKTTFVLNTIMERNNSFLNATLYEHLHTFTSYGCTYQILGCPTTCTCPGPTDVIRCDQLFLCNAVESMVRQTQSSDELAIPLLNNIWMLCGRRAYQRIPAWWSGRCTLGYIAPSVIVLPHLPPGRLRNRRNIDASTNPLTYNWDTQLSRGLLPPLGVAMNYRDLHLLSNWTTTLFKATIHSLKLINEELSQIREIGLQNRYALDIMLAAKGGVCALIHSHCCVYVTDYKANISATIEHMEKLVENNPIGSTIPQSPWEWLWSWLPDFGWIRQIVSIVILVIIALICCFCCIQCLPGLLAIFRPRIRPSKSEIMYACKILKNKE